MLELVIHTVGGALIGALFGLAGAFVALKCANPRRASSRLVAPPVVGAAIAFVALTGEVAAIPVAIAGLVAFAVVLRHTVSHPEELDFLLAEV